jgi:carbamoyltransferase
LKEFDALTGVPVLVNTSFNVKGEPIIETPQDALDCFLTTGIDYLAMHDLLIEKRWLNRVVLPVSKFFSEISALVRTTMEAETRPAPR